MINFLKKNVFIICFVIVFLLQDIILESIIKEHYLHKDLNNFNSVAWKYSLSFVVLIVAIIIFTIRKSFKFSQTPNIFITFLILGICFYLALNKVCENVLLYINLKINEQQIVKTYEVINHKEFKTFWLNGNVPIHDYNDLEILNQNRIKDNQKSIFDYKNGDTISIKFNRGIINVDYPSP